MLMIRDFSTMFQQMSGMPINSKGGKNMLKQAGIDTNSKQYKAAMNMMSSSAGAAVGYTNPQAIKNLMQNFDANGDMKDPVTGLTGLNANGIPMSQRHKIIDIPENAREVIFQATKRAFQNDYGTGTGDRSYRNEIYTNLQRSLPKEDRLKGSWTLQQYEEAYEKALTDACKQVDPTWKPTKGRSLPAGALDSVTREAVESTLVKEYGEFGETLTRKSVNISV